MTKLAQLDILTQTGLYWKLMRSIRYIDHSFEDFIIPFCVRMKFGKTDTWAWKWHREIIGTCAFSAGKVNIYIISSTTSLWMLYFRYVTYHFVCVINKLIMEKDLINFSVEHCESIVLHTDDQLSLWWTDVLSVRHMAAIVFNVTCSCVTASCPPWCSIWPNSGCFGFYP